MALIPPVAGRHPLVRPKCTVRVPLNRQLVNILTKKQLKLFLKIYHNIIPMVRLAGIEPAAFPFGGGRSIH